MIGEAILHYRVVEQMGAGGMGVVYRALDTRLGRSVALKFLPEASRLDVTARVRLMAEAEAAARLDHPNIGTIYGIDDVDNHPFIVMALYEGETLTGRLARGPVRIDEAVDIAAQVLRGLALAHGVEVVHRDIKPDNLFLTAQGFVKILDFGLAKIDQMDGLTSAGSVFGTLEYMSPEQIRGQAVDGRTDLWALGVVLYQVLTGVSPFRTDGGMTASILKIIKDDPEPVATLRPEVPTRLAEVLDRALAKDRDARYGSAAAMSAALEAALRQSTTVASAAVARAAAATAPAVAPPAATPAAPIPAPPTAAKGAAPAPSVLPTPSSPLVGRHDELSIIATNLADPHCRVLTLFGPGGTGKTRLVIQAAANEVERASFPDGVFFVPLDSLSDPDLIPSTIGRTLGIDLEPHEPAVTQVGRHIGDRRMLVVLDNYEHVMEGAHLPSELVQACPGLRILVTSRERLNLEEEWVLPLPGLSVPHVGATTHEEAHRYDAVQLFVNRAKRSRLNFSLEDEDPVHVCHICRLVVGSPLGIELAAAWVKMMGCDEIAQEIQSSIDFLESSNRNVTARHRSIRACFEYSWTLLSPKEQDVFARLSVFQGSFTRDAAKEVAGTSLPFLVSLVDKSLLHVEGGRYEGHPLLRQYAGEKLAERTAAKQDSETKHGAYFLKFVQGVVGQDDELARLDLDMPEVLVAMQQADDRGDAGTLVAFMRLLAIEGGYYTARGYTPRSRDLLAAAITAAKDLGELMTAHRLLGKMGDTRKLHHGDREAALAAYEEALDLAEQLEDHHRQAVMLSLIGQTRLEQGEDDAGDYLDRAYQIAREHDDAIALNHVLQHQGFHAGSTGEWVAARRLFSEALEVLDAASGVPKARRLDVDYQLFMALLNLGEAERMLGSFERALDLRQRALAMAEERDNRLWRAYAVHEIGEVYHSMNERELALQQFEHALGLWQQNHVPRKVASLRTFLEAEGYVTGGSGTRAVDVP
ncbi:hypothetical protein BH23DEI1_BH23DEI1_13550 [soil metagenome]